VPLNYEIDTENYVNKNNPKAQQKLHALMAELDLVDVWRKNNASVKRYTWRGPNRKRSRLDCLLVSSDLETFVINSDIGVIYKSDHSPVYLTFQFIKKDRSRGTWKFNNTLLSDHDYVSVVKNTIKEVVSQYRVNSEDDDGKYFSINDKLLWETMKVMIRGKTISYSSYKNKEKNQSESDLEKQLVSYMRIMVTKRKLKILRAN
jgi:hypothetical protein